jgi:hypothetical protein
VKIYIATAFPMASALAIPAATRAEATGGTGCWFEMGYAFGIGKLVVVSGPSRTIFHSLYGVHRFTDHDEALSWIASRAAA